jgi:hypothetical protein
MKRAIHVRPWAARAAAVAAAVAGLSAVATPAMAATAPTATLANGTVTVTGTAGQDQIGITVGANQLAVDFGQDGTTDAHFPMSAVQRISVLGGAGDDGVNVSGTGVGSIPIVVSAGGGDDGIGVVGNIGDDGTGDARITLIGGGGNDQIVAAAPGPVTINTGAGDDHVDGGGAGIGHETISLGDGNDTFVSELNAFVGARSDNVDGGAGKDAMEMRGSFASESLTLAASAGHLIVTHDGQDRINSHDVENLTWFGFGGLDETGAGDTVNVHDLSGTGVVNFTPDFSAPQDGTTPNNSADQLTVTGTPGDDHIALSSVGDTITVSGLTESVTPVLLNSKDTLRINTLAGNDTVDTFGLQAGQVQLQVF